jgi:hypothetical protein
MEDLIKKVFEDWKWQVKDMSDYELNEDRSEWMKNYGRKHKSDLVDDFESDIHTISIELEQLRRNREIYYGD